MSIGGVQVDDASVTTQISNLDYEVNILPNIVGYLQNETQLTRKSIVDILTGTDKLKYFKINPQKFIEGCIDIINDQMRIHIIDGVKYHKIGGNDFYKQELFENEELFGYLKNNLSESTKSPYEYVVYDSKVESTLSKQFEQSKNVNLYAKLPNWFKINTPLGSYNPDWVVSWKNDDEEKLYFVVESKGSTSDMDLRPKEQSKIECGKRHFKELGSGMVVATTIGDIQ